MFLLNIPRLEFAALIPKGGYLTMVLLGKDIDKELVESLLNTPEIKLCFPPDYDLTKNSPCKCFPEINIKSALKPFRPIDVSFNFSFNSKCLIGIST